MKNKKVYFLIFSFLLIVVVVVVLFMGRGRVPDTKVKVLSNSYVDRIFDTSYVHTINIKISDSDWNDLIKNPLNKTKYRVDVVIDGLEISNVSFKTKGNSSLRMVANSPEEGPASNRYSFKINFSKYVKNQTYFGLDKLNLNNLYADASYLNDYVSYDMFRKMGVPTPLISFIYVKINGRDFGLYHAIEEVGDAFLKRNGLNGDLYKPEQVLGVDRGASLKYVDDDVDSYTDIFDNSETKSVREDWVRVVSSLKKLSEGEIDDVLDIDEVIRYFAVHNFLLSYDSYTGGSIHNYYLYESDSKLSLFPWDYNLAFGRYDMNYDTSVILNYGIDSPLNHVVAEDRPMWNVIASNPPYLEKYHSYLEKLYQEYYLSKDYLNVIHNTSSLISEYVKKDRSAFYTYSEFSSACSMLEKFMDVRFQSIKKQLDGDLNRNHLLQEADERVDTSSIDLSVIGEVPRNEK